MSAPGRAGSAIVAARAGILDFVRTRAVVGGALLLATLTLACGDEGPLPTPPVATFALAPRFGPPETYFVVDATQSTDEEDDPSALEARWDWEGDGTWDTDYSTTKYTSHRYDGPGDRWIVVEVRDTSRLTSTFRRYLHVFLPLQCEALATPVSGLAPLTVAFEASATDGHGVNRYTWDFGDSTSSSEDLVEHTYTTPGVYRAALLVEDLAYPSEICRDTIEVTVLAAADATGPAPQLPPAAPNARSELRSPAP